VFRFLSSPSARLLTLILVFQAVAYYTFARTEEVPIATPLSTFPKEFGGWKLVQEATMEKEILDVLRADEVFTRWYTHAESNELVSLFIAYFNTQRTGKAPHSPRNCLPGSGWTPTVNDRIQIALPGRPPIEANRYIVAKGQDKSLVIYWYQNHVRTVASEYTAKIYTVLDALRYNRSDVAIVKVTIPMRGDGHEHVTNLARQFVLGFYDKLLPYFPS
jgi:EpsI family protein